MDKEPVKRPAVLKSHDQNMEYAVLNHLLLNKYMPIAIILRTYSVWALDVLSFWCGTQV